MRAHLSVSKRRFRFLVSVGDGVRWFFRCWTVGVAIPNGFPMGLPFSMVSHGFPIPNGFPMGFPMGCS